MESSLSTGLGLETPRRFAAGVSLGVFPDRFIWGRKTLEYGQHRSKDWDPKFMWTPALVFGFLTTDALLPLRL